MRASCRDRLPRDSQRGVVVTFAEPIPWGRVAALERHGVGGWTAFESIGSRAGDGLTWTCGGPFEPDLALKPCRRMGVRPDGVTAAVGFFDDDGVDALRAELIVAQVDSLRDSVTNLLFDVGGFGVEAPGLTVNDAYWELFLAD